MLGTHSSPHLPGLPSQTLPDLTHSLPPGPPVRGLCCCYLYDLNTLMHKWDRSHSAATSKSVSFPTCSLRAFTSAAEVKQKTLLTLLFLEKHLPPRGDGGTKTTCLLNRLFKEATSQQLASWVLNVDLATLRRSSVYCCCSLDFIWGAEFVKKKIQVC